MKRVISSSERSAWVKQRAEVTTREMRELCRLATSKGAPVLYCDNSFPEPERFLGAIAVTTNDEFVPFINICNRCLVESVERMGRSVGNQKYFWTEIKVAYPDLWDALQRVKIYRNNDLHLELMPTVEAELKRFNEIDLEGRRIAQVPDVWFVLQQSVLDGLLLGVQCELNRYS